MLNTRKIVLLITLLLQSYCVFSESNDDITEFIHEEKNDIQMFVLLKYDRLTSEIMTGKGDYLDALLYLIKKNRPYEKKSKELNNIKNILLNSPDVFHFSIQMKKYSVL